MVLSTRPEWTRSTTGVPIDCIVRVNGGSLGARQDILTSRSRVSIVRPGALQARPEEEYGVGYVYGPEASNADITARSIQPLLRKFLEGYNTTVIVFGATGAGKTTSLEGGKAKDSIKNSDQGDGLVHLAIDELFRMINHKAAAVGDLINQKRRAPSAKAFDFFLETSFLELYNEGCHDLYQRGAASQANLPIFEDDVEGYQVSGLTYRLARDASELRSSFNAGRAQRGSHMTDLGSVHERAASLFTVQLSQFAPAAVPGEEDRVLISRLTFVDMPGAERLTMDPELLRLREGNQLNRSLLGFVSVLRSLSERGGSADYANYEESILTRLLAESLGGNCLTLMMGVLKQGEWENSTTTMHYLSLAGQSRNFPIINHGRARGLLHKMRQRLLAIANDRETLRDQMMEVPADGDPNAVAVSIARVRDLEARLLVEREEKAALVEDKAALQGRLMQLRDAGTDELVDKTNLQEALIKSEELRLALANTLVNTQMEFNDLEGSWINEKHDLEKRIVELEASHMEQYVRIEDHTAMQQERDILNTRLLAVQDELERRVSHIKELKKELSEVKTELRKAETTLNMVGDPTDPKNQKQRLEELEGERLSVSRGNAQLERVEQKRQQLFDTLKEKDRKVMEQANEIREMQKELDRARNARSVTQTGVDEMREAYRRRLETMMRDLTDLSRAVAIMQDDPGTGVRVTPENLFNAFQKLTDENLKVTDDREREMRRDLDELQNRHLELRRKLRSLALAYRKIRYMIEDRWPEGSEPLQVPPEEQILSVAMEDISRTEESADRRLMDRLREKASHLGSQLGALQVADAAAAQGVRMRPANLTRLPREDLFETKKFVGMPEMLKLENDKLLEELSNRNQGPTTPVEKLQKENERLKAQVQSLSSDKDRASLALELAAAKKEARELQERLKSSARAGLVGAKIDSQAEGKVVMDLERQLMAADSRRIMAEEQLANLQKHMTQATTQYQREISRLRAIVKQAEASGALPKDRTLRMPGVP
uniref:Kinesin motor domain-containing protein n=1 Tax=Dunaliella tertiolecta TaxID=3047 RepID=A0A7S3VM07_DUNTE|mmetsp:Transcript_6398/g.17074  ORF Transcript_6398/g.17074 Transcript_6398/m.17074 type:complete len:1006 (+) Transcript_6398:675-3692(+)